MSLVLLLLSPWSASADHGEPLGANFGIADAAGPAWPGAKAWWAGTCDLSAASTTGGGVGPHNGGTAPPPNFAHCIDHGGPYSPTEVDATPPLDTTWTPGAEPSWRLDPVAQAGAHPDATASFWMQRSPDPSLSGVLPILSIGDGDTRTVEVKLPPGLVGNPNAVPACSSADARRSPLGCGPETQVGVSTITTSSSGGTATSVFAVYNVEPRDGKTAEFLINAAPNAIVRANIPIVAKARTSGDFGIDTMVLDVPGGLPLLGQSITLWGVPWASSHDRYRPRTGYLGHTTDGEVLGGMPEAGLTGDTPDAEPASYDPSWGPIRPFFTNPTECDPVAPVTIVEVSSWQDPGVFKPYKAPADVPVDGCAAVPFQPSFDMRATSTVANDATGLEADMTIPQNDDPPASVAHDPDDATGAPAHWKSPAGLATAQLDKAVVTLPPDVAINPAGAAGLEGCSDEQIGLVAVGNPPTFNDEDPFDGAGAECPAGSRIGTAEVFTPILPGADEQSRTPNLTGEVVLGTPKSINPESGDMFRLFLVVRNRQRGLLAKIAGSTVVDAQTGRITATFDKNPRVPFETMKLRLKGGAHGLLALPPRCESAGWSSLFTPWTAAHGAGGRAVGAGGSFVTNTRCSLGFSPTLRAGMSSQQAVGGGSFSFQLTRGDGDQFLSELSATMSSGLLASVRSVPLCSNGQAAANACPSSSQIGVVDAGAGSGAPYFLERKGSVFLTEGYKGAPYGLAVSVPVEAGPFKGPLALSTIVVRQALHVDRRTAQVTVVSDPFPRIWHGIPLRVRQVTVAVNRPGFMVNPSDCSPKQIAATVLSTEGARADLAYPFQASGCAALRFRPKIRIALTGKRQRRTGKHPGVRAVVTQRAGEARIEKAVVRLPKSLALDPDNARALCEFEDGTRDDLENHCPRGSIVGRARAVSPLLKRPLVGNVYFVKNVRIDKRTGNEIRTLPMIVVALRGEIAINLRGESSTTKGGKLVNTFAGVPDAPVSRFNLNIKGGKNGILTVTRTRRARIDLCAKPKGHRAVTDVDGHNGKHFDRNIRVKTPCGKRSKAQRRKAAAKRRKAAARRRARQGPDRQDRPSARRSSTPSG
ncbi:MAG TPA: hypothetical protein VHF88_07080 [Thermoleophilaceae bacterium]|nr:hypothetical protein [Thermoleophilaceae bacterium]